MSRPVFTRSSILMEDTAVTVTTPDGTDVTVTPNSESDPSSLDLPPAATPVPAAPIGSEIEDPELAALAASLAGDPVGTPDPTTVVIDRTGGVVPDEDAAAAPEVNDDTDISVADDIADATADAVDDSADEVSGDFEAAEQRLLLADDIGTYGLTAAGFDVGRKLGLLAGGAFDSMSAESLRMTPITAGSRDCAMSQESLISTAAKSVADFGARALSHTSGVTRRLLNMATKEESIILSRMAKLNPVSAGKAAGASVANAARSAGASAGRAFAADGALRNAVRAAGKAAVRPRNAAIAVAIVGAIAGATKLVQVAFKSAPPPGTPVAEMQGWFGKVRSQVSAIKWPFGKLTVKDTSEHVASPGIRDRIGRLFCKDRPVTGAQDAVKGFASYRVTAKEWTEASLKSFKDGFTRAMGDLKAALTGGGEGFVRTIKNGFTGVAPEGAGKATMVLSRGAYAASIFAVFAIVASAVFFVVAGGCRIIRRQLEG